ncbi:hypothetical protein GCM10010909_18150 [Acidocella aquatica]|uniref:Outer membrane porin, OprD family n=2 Tax=Acidocella aquatica TaxID=1922313 RepID=A0ABQ6A3S7_9PROT|nr:hypothetical protein GCM10010909_18150 [Acidocella aquatica]
MGGISLLAAAVMLAAPARAQSLQDALRQTTFTGELGLTNFTYANAGHSGNMTNGFGVGGHLIVHTGALDGFSVGLGGYTGQSLGLYSHNPAHDDTELTGRTHSLQSVREAYLQFENPWLEVRGGRQMLNTPYANQDLYTFSPRAFMGFSGVANIIGGSNGEADAAPMGLKTSTATLSVFGARIFGYNSRYSSDFTTGNRYLSKSNGFIAAGARYQNTFAGTNVSLQGWYYDFYGLGQLVYGQADFATPLSANETVFGAAQMLAEGNSGNGISRYGSVDAHIYGGKLGMSFGADDVAMIGDYSPIAYNSFRHGGVIHPYNDNSGTTFTDTMQTGIPDFGPGYAIGITGDVVALDGKLKISPTYVEYKVDYGFGGNVYNFSGPYAFPTGTPVHDQAIHVIDSNFNYNLSSVLPGLSADWDADAAFAENGNQGQHFNNPYFSSRIYLKYDF